MSPKDNMSRNRGEKYVESLNSCPLLRKQRVNRFMYTHIF